MQVHDFESFVQLPRLRRHAARSDARTRLSVNSTNCGTNQKNTSTNTNSNAATSTKNFFIADARPCSTLRYVIPISNLRIARAARSS